MVRAPVTAPARGTPKDGDQLDAATCKLCEAPILWAVTVHGRPIPLDAKPERRFVLSHDMPRLMVQRDVFMPHHATCPKAAEFKKPAAGDAAPAAAEPTP